MKRPSYRATIEYIALNDEPGELDPENVRGFISVQTMAFAFGVEPEKVARDIVRYRKNVTL